MMSVVIWLGVVIFVGLHVLVCLGFPSEHCTITAHCVYCIFNFKVQEWHKKTMDHLQDLTWEKGRPQSTT